MPNKIMVFYIIMIFYIIMLFYMIMVVQVPAVLFSKHKETCQGPMRATVLHTHTHNTQ